MKATALWLLLLIPVGANAVIVCGDGLASSNLADDTEFRAPAFAEFQVISNDTGGGAPANTLLWLLVGQETEPRIGYFDTATRRAFVGDPAGSKNREMAIDEIVAWAPARVDEMLGETERAEVEVAQDESIDN